MDFVPLLLILWLIIGLAMSFSTKLLNWYRSRRWDTPWLWLALMVGLALLGAWPFDALSLELAFLWWPWLLATPSLGLGLSLVLWARQRTRSGEDRSQYRQNLRRALVGLVAFVLAALLLPLGLQLLTPSYVRWSTWSPTTRFLWYLISGWRLLLLAYGGFVALLLRSGRRDRRTTWTRGSPEQVVGRIALLELLGIALYGAWGDLRWLVADVLYVVGWQSAWWPHLDAVLGLCNTLLRGGDLLLWHPDPYWIAGEALRLLAVITLSLWMFLLLWDRLGTCRPQATGESV